MKRNILSLAVLAVGAACFTGCQEDNPVDYPQSSLTLVTKGVYIIEVEEGSPAEKAGIHAGDIIVEVNGQVITSVDEEVAIVSKLKEGDEIYLYSGIFKYTYEVVRYQYIPDNYMEYLKNRPYTLTLFTCSGFNWDTGIWEQRVIVLASLFQIDFIE